MSIRRVALISAFYPSLARRVAPVFEARQAISAPRKHQVRKEEL
jgi:hypothetical protein